LDIEYVVTGITVEMAMLLHIWAEACRPAVHRDLPGEAGTDECIQTVVNRRHRNIRHVPFGADKDLLRSRVILLLQEHIVNALALRSKPKAACHQALVERTVRFFLLDQTHCGSTLAVLHVL